MHTTSIGFGFALGRVLCRALALAVALGSALAVGGCDDDGGGPRTVIVCAPLDLIIVFDTSGSMDDEADAVCDKVEEVEGRLADAGIETAALVLGVTEDSGNKPESFRCLSDNVRDLLGAEVPGRPGEALDQEEDWGAATAIVAARFPWADDAARVVVPISDEAPHEGDPCDDPGADRTSADNAIDVADDNGVIVAPVAGTGAEPCVETLMRDIAEGTGGEFHRTRNPSGDIADTLLEIGAATCEEVVIP